MLINIGVCPALQWLQTEACHSLPVGMFMITILSFVAIASRLTSHLVMILVYIALALLCMFCFLLCNNFCPSGITCLSIYTSLYIVVEKLFVVLPKIV